MSIEERAHKIFSWRMNNGFRGYTEKEILNFIDEWEEITKKIKISCK